MKPERRREIVGGAVLGAFGAGLGPAPRILGTRIWGGIKVWRLFSIQVASATMYNVRGHDETDMALLDTMIPQAPPLQMVEGGAIRVAGTRVSLDSVIGAFDAGATPEEIVLKFPALRLADIYATIAYYLDHVPEVRAYLDARHTQAEELRETIVRTMPSNGLRERLLARQAAGSASKGSGRHEAV